MNCNYFTDNICRSCTLLELGSQNAFQYKTGKARELLKDFIHNAIEEDGIYASEAFGSRHKAKLVVSGDSNNAQFGIVTSTGDFTALESCPIHSGSINRLLPPLRNLIKDFNLKPYDIRKRTGELKAVIISSNLDNTEFMVRLILKSRKLIEAASNALSELTISEPLIKVTSINIQPIAHAILEGDQEFITSRQTYIIEKFGDVSLCFDPKSFMQVTPKMAQDLYQSAANWIQDSKPSNVLDLYCGVGGFGLHAASRCNEVVGVEATLSAVECARAAAKINGFTNCSFINGNLDTYKVESICDTVIVNPPRRGLSHNTHSFISCSKPKSIIYSSCNINSLVEDLNKCLNDYHVTKFKFFDMFPLTEHIETLVQLQLR